MKQGIHPNYHDVEVQCACGETFKTRSTYNGDVIKIDICSKCHPFYSGKKKVVDSEGRVERFKKRYNLN